MLKYNTALKDIEGNNSFWKILKQMKPGSTVLECGCATGYMTKYMKERLDCKVYIIEYEEAAFNIAKQYAVDGICTDLTKDEWLKKFAEIEFDYVLFTDVLEHLSDPVEVLMKAKKLCKKDGTFLISIPNVCHNDILLNMYNDNWNYTPLGLLDDTHIKFWGLNNISTFLSKANLKIVNLDCTIIPTLRTEQKPKLDETDDLFYSALLCRERGEVYQYIIAAKDINEKTEEFNNSKLCTLIEENYKSIIYCKYNEEKDAVIDEIQLKNLSNIYQRYQLQNREIKQIEYQLIDMPFVIVRNIVVESNIGNIDTKIMGGCRSKIGDIFVEGCPRYEILANRSDIEWIVIKANFFRMSENSNFSNCIKDYVYINNEIDKKNREIDKKNEEIQSILTSKSWKITKPLRWFIRIFKHGN